MAVATLADRCVAVAVVGAGDAGHAAAGELVRRGVECLLLDDGLAPFSSALTAADPSSGVEVLVDTSVWDLESGLLRADAGGRSLTVYAHHIVLANGSRDRVVPFPGWTLPGVITCGAARSMLRDHGVAPGRRAVVAGTGPLLLETASALASGGIDVVALLEARRSAPRLPLPGRFVRDQRQGWTVFAAGGTDRLQRVVIGRVDGCGQPIRGTERELQADLLCLAFGRVPSIELALRAGCTVHHLDLRGGWLPDHGSTMATSIPSLRVAGSVAGTGSARAAAAEGALAGRAIARELGHPSPPLDGLQSLVAAERRRADAILARNPPLPGLRRLARPGTIVCRCEDVTLAEVRAASRLHGEDLRSIKLATRAGMGPCQGRYCQREIAELLDLQRPGVPSRVQLPVVPVPVGWLTGTGH